MSKNSLLFFFLICAYGACSSKSDPPMPVYDTVIVIEEEPRLSANAEIVDITGDGINDIVLAIGRHWPGPNLLFSGDGNGGFTSIDSLSKPWDRSYSVSVADMDLDEDMDLIVSNDRPDSKYVLLNDGNGNFSEQFEFGNPEWPTRNITVADLNQDEFPDIIVANRDASPKGNNWVCLNTTEEEFSLSCKSIVSGSSTTIAVEDMNADGMPDLIIPYRDGGQSYVFLGNGAGLFEQGPAFGPKDASFRAALPIDLNNDHLTDIVAIDDRKKTTSVFYQTEPLKFEKGIRIDDGEMVPYALEIADLDKNSKMDIIIGYRQAPTRLYFNRNNGLVHTIMGDSLGATYGFGVGDFNHDEIPDIVSARSGASDILFLGTLKNQ